MYRTIKMKQQFWIIIILHCFFLITLCSTLSLECYACNSMVDPECATNPGQQINVEECLSTETDCVTAIFFGVTHRGCFSKVIPSKVCGNLCETCNTSLCNHEIYPRDRINCFQCRGADCVVLKEQTSMPCVKYIELDRCYTNIINPINVDRGCVSSLNESEPCKNICLKCNYDGCNNEPGTRNLTCHSCRSQPLRLNYDCMRNQETFDDQCKIKNITTCSSKILYGHKGKCFRYMNEQTSTYERGCSSNKGFYPTGILEECFGEMCNEDCNDIKCIQCDAAIDPSCRNNTRILKTTTCPASTVSCHSCEEGTNLVRGCGFPDIAKKNCHRCSTADGCNSENVRTCYKCTSTRDVNCEKMLNISNMTTETCSSIDENCVTTLATIATVTYTVRGCENNVIECTEGNPFCNRCVGSLCNTETISTQLKLVTMQPKILTQSKNYSAHLKYNNIFILLSALLFIFK